VSSARVSAGWPGRLRSFDPVRVADLEYRLWVGYYLRSWPHLLVASIRLVWMGFGMDWMRTLQGAWLMLRAIQLWQPYPAEAAVRPAAAHRVQAMDLSDQWVREGCASDSPLLPLERAALVRAYAALLAAVHHEELP
jgi:hypothetical protein